MQVPGEILMRLIGPELIETEATVLENDFRVVRPVNRFNGIISVAKLVCKDWYCAINSIYCGANHAMTPLYKLIRGRCYLSAIARMRNGGCFGRNRAARFAVSNSNFGLFRLIWETTEKTSDKPPGKTSISRLYRAADYYLTDGQAAIIEYLCVRGYTNQELSALRCCRHPQLLKWSRLAQSAKYGVGVDKSWNSVVCGIKYLMAPTKEPEFTKECLRFCTETFSFDDIKYARPEIRSLLVPQVTRSTAIKLYDNIDLFPEAAKEIIERYYVSYPKF